MATKIDYEVEDYETYAATAQTLLGLGLVHEARIYETLADLCYEKASMLTKIEKMRDTQRRYHFPNSPDRLR